MTVAMPGDFGKPQPALVIQSDLFSDAATLTVLLISSTHQDAPLMRIAVEPNEANGLRRPSQIMVDKIMTVRRDKIGDTIGRIDPETMGAVTRSLAVFLGFA